MLSPKKNARTLNRRLEVPRALRAFVRARESSLLFLGARVGAFRDFGIDLPPRPRSDVVDPNPK
jgi:hypothetical protein